MLRITVWLMAIAGATPCNSLKLDLAPTGCLDIGLDGRTIVTGGLVCYGPQWSATRQEQCGDAVPSGAGRCRGSFAMPRGNRGTLAFDQTVRQTGGEIQVNYTVTFDHENDIKRQAVALHFPADVFAGRKMTFFPAEAVLILPREPSRLVSDHFGWAFAVELGVDRVLLVQTTGATLLSVSDARQWQGGGFNLYVRMVDEGKVPAGATTRRRIQFSLVSPAEARRRASRWWPDFDRTRASLLFDANGRLWMRDRQRDYASAALVVHGIHWAYSSQDEMVGCSESDDGRRTISGMVPVRGPGGTGVRFEEAVREVPGGVDLAYSIDFSGACRLNSYSIIWSLRTEEFAGQRIDLIGPAPTTRGQVPSTQLLPGVRPLSATGAPSGGATLKGPVPFSATSRNVLTIPLERPAKAEVGTFTASRIAVAPDHPLGFALELDQPTSLRIEDRRADDSQTYELQLQFLREEKGTVVSMGTANRRQIRVRPNRHHQVLLDDTAYAHRTDTQGWVPYTLPWDTSAVDLSFLNDGPAGRHGFLQASGDRFVFTDGTPAHFWGTCFTAEQNLPPRRDAEAVAARLARYGVNMVRIHQADAGYVGDNLFRARWKGKGTRQLDPEMMDRLDYLIDQLKRHGIYVYLDLLSTRTFEEADGVASAAQLDLAGKPYASFDEHLIRLQEEFTRQFLTHRNPYTKLAYKDDPVVALVALVNENDLFSDIVEVEPYRTRFELLYRAWAWSRGIRLPAEKIDLRHMTPDLMRFMVEVQRTYNRRMMRFVRSLGVKAPVTGSNWTANAGLIASLGPVDFTDSHGYWDHCWDNYTRIRNRVMVMSRSTIFSRLAFQRVPDKPFFCSEWGQPWPNECRAEMPLAVASVAALQGWGGALIYTYAHRSDPTVDCLSGPFETFNDPCLWGLFYHAALLLRRGDVGPANDRLAVQIPEKDVYAEKPASPARCPAYDVSAERSWVATALGEKVPAGWRGVPCSQPVVPQAAHTVTSDTGQYTRDWKEGVATINTPRTQAAWGFIGGRSIRLADVEFAISTPFAVAVVSSLTDEPINRSGRLLLTAVARAENTGMVYDLFHTRKIEAGHGPILIESVRGQARIRTACPRMRARCLGPRGEVVRELPAAYETDRLLVDLGPQNATMYYLIESLE